MLLREPHNTTIRELLDPISRLPHPVLNRDGKAGAMAVAIEHVSFRALFSGEGSMVVNEVHMEELEFFSLSVMLPRPLLTVLPVFVFTLLEGADEATSDVSDGVKVISDLDGGCSCAR
jgi:hypothetical protein